MPDIIHLPSLKKYKARRAHAKELRSRENELRFSHQQMRAIDAQFNNDTETSSPPAYHTRSTEQQIHSVKMRELSASEHVEIRPSSDFSINSSRK